MKIERIRNGSLRVWLSDRELEDSGLQFATMEYAQPGTRRLIRGLLRVAAERVGFSGGDRLLVEAVPVPDGCMLLFTPVTVALPMAGPYVYRLRSAEHLLQLAQHWEAQNAAGAAPVENTVYIMQEENRETYRLVLYPSDNLPDVRLRLLEEYSDPVDSGAAAAAMVAEHGQLLAAGDALHRFCAPEGHRA